MPERRKPGKKKSPDKAEKEDRLAANPELQGRDTPTSRRLRVGGLVKVRIKKLEATGRKRQENSQRMTWEEETQQDKFNKLSTTRHQEDLEGGGATPKNI